MPLKPSSLVLALALFASGMARAGDEDVKKRFESRFPGVTVTNVRPAPMPGLYELFVNGELLYADEGVNYVIQGTLIRAADRRNLTEERLEKLKGIPFAQLPLDLAIKIVKGDGSRKVAVFEDPDCPFCRRLEQDALAHVDNITMYVLLYPLEGLHPGATGKSARIWCSADRGKAWTDAVQGKANPTAAPTCKTPLEPLKKFAEARGIFATPTLVFEDGSRVAGAIPADDIEKRLSAARSQQRN